MLVDALATDWGTRPADTGKTVWFTLNLPNANLGGRGRLVEGGGPGGQ